MKKQVRRQTTENESQNRTAAILRLNINVSQIIGRINKGRKK